jgi:hypothetical protein
VLSYQELATDITLQPVARVQIWTIGNKC